MTMYLPSDHSKGVYLLRAYHQLHCLGIVRAPSIRILINAMNRVIGKTFWEAVERRAYTWSPSAHTDHCFDAPRQMGPPFQITDRRCRWYQYVICNADNVPLYTFGDDTAGDRQLHRWP